MNTPSIFDGSKYTSTGPEGSGPQGLKVRGRGRFFGILGETPIPALFINGLTTCLRAGSDDRLLEAIWRSETFIVNVYVGRLIADDLGSVIIRREREFLAKVRGKWTC